MEPPLAQRFFLTIQLRHPVSCPAAVWICNERIRSNMTTEKCQCVWSSACPATHQGDAFAASFVCKSWLEIWKWQRNAKKNQLFKRPPKFNYQKWVVQTIPHLETCTTCNGAELHQCYCWRLPHSVGAVPWRPHTFRQVSTCLSCLTNRHDNRYCNVDTHTEVCIYI